jgi:hypothetical protein
VKNILFVQILLTILLPSWSMSQNISRLTTSPHASTAATLNLVNDTDNTIRNIQHITLLPQITRVLCWAASIQMITQYHAQTMSIHKILMARDSSYANDAPDTCDYRAFHDTNSQLPAENWNYPVEQDGIEPYQQRELEIILSNLGYYGHEDATKLEWSVILKQINNCHPFLISIYDSGKEEDPENRHVVVVKGYWISKNGDKYIIVYDPYGQCVGQAYSLAYESLSDPSSHNKIYNHVINIYSKTNTDCIACREDQTVNEVMEPRELYIQTAFSINEDSLIINTDLVSQLTENVVNVNIVSNKKILDSTATGEDIYLDYQIKDIIIDKNTVVRVQRLADQKWHIIKVIENFYTAHNFSGNLPKQYIMFPGLKQAYFRSKTDNTLNPQYDISESSNRGKTIKPDQFSKTIKEQSKLINTQILTQRLKSDITKFEKNMKTLDTPLHKPEIELLKTSINKLKEKLN